MSGSRGSATLKQLQRSHFDPVPCIGPPTYTLHHPYILPTPTQTPTLPYPAAQSEKGLDHVRFDSPIASAQVGITALAPSYHLAQAYSSLAQKAQHADW